MPDDWTADLLEKYEAWFSTRITVDPVEDGFVEITTPFLDHHNDHVQVYVRRNANGDYFLTDDAYALHDLASSGVEIEGEHRVELLNTTLRGFGIDRDDEDALTTRASDDDLGERVNALIQAVLAVDGLYVVARSRVQSMFFDDVRRFMASNNIRYDEKPKFVGRSGYRHTFDFAVHGQWEQGVRIVNGRSETIRPTNLRLLQAVATPSRQSVTQDIFQFNDVREQGNLDFRPLAFLDDAEPISEDTYNAFDQYDIVAVPWSDTERVRTELALVS